MATSSLESERVDHVATMNKGGSDPPTYAGNRMASLGSGGDAGSLNT